MLVKNDSLLLQYGIQVTVIEPCKTNTLPKRNKNRSFHLKVDDFMSSYAYDVIRDTFLGAFGNTPIDRLDDKCLDIGPVEVSLSGGVYKLLQALFQPS